MDFSRILNKPFLITTIPWTTSTVTRTELTRIPFPAALYTNALAKIPFDSSCMYRMKMCLLMQVSGTPMHQGTLIAASFPNGSSAIVNPNQMMNAPHVFLSANESTSVCLNVPFYINSTLANTAGSKQPISFSGFDENFADLVIYVMNPLAVSTGSSTTISVSIHAMILEADFYVPKVGSIGYQSQGFTESFSSFTDVLYKIPTQIFDSVASGAKNTSRDLIDSLRKSLRMYTGFHNPNSTSVDMRMIPTLRNFPNLVDQPTLYEKLDPHSQYDRIYNDFYFRTDTDEMSLNHLLSKPAYVGTFNLTSNDSTGKNLMALPISPMVEYLNASSASDSLLFYSNLRTFYELSRFWRGGLKLHIQSNMTNFHYCKLLVVRNYSMDVLAATKVPLYKDTHNLITDTLEFSAGGQIQTIDLPYCSPLDQIECSKDLVAAAFAHGMMYVYLVQPLTYNSNVPTFVNFNCYITAGEDFQYYGYSTDNYQLTPGTAPTYPTIPNITINTDEQAPYLVVNKRYGVEPSFDTEDRAKFRYPKTKTEVDKEKKAAKVEAEKKIKVVEVPKKPTETNLSYVAQSLFEKDKIRNFAKSCLCCLLPSCARCLLEKPISEAASYVSNLSWFAQAEVTVAPSSQDALINEDTAIPSNVFSKHFHPMTNVRDYLRRMHPLPVIAVAPTTGTPIGIHTFRIADYFNSFLATQNAFQVISNMYLGMSGGFKMKFVISGAAAASLRFYPPGITNSNIQTYNTIYPTVPVATGQAPVVDGFNERERFEAFGDSLSSTVPFIETGITIASYAPIQIPNQDLGPASLKNDNLIVIEATIPNMSMYDFVGDAATSRNNYLTTNDLGWLALNLVYANSSLQTFGVSITPYIGIADETRFGFQVYAPQKQLRYITATGSVRVRETVFNASTAINPYGAPYTQATTAPVMFYMA